ncbi:PKD-like domain-containing protein, partial [Bacteroidota bacterium]
MRIKFTSVIFIFSLFLVFSAYQTYGEGTKELMPDSASNKRAYILIANGNVGGNYRDPFALYNGDTSYRLFINISDHVKEKIYFGIGATTTGGAVNWRLHRPNGVVVWSGTTPTSNGQQGFIRYYNQAYVGPTKLSPSGYPALVVDPTENGNYFMTFQVGNGQSRSFEKIDISVIDTTTLAYKKGRVYSKAWQLNTNDPNVHGFFGYMFVYSQDSIVTRFTPNGFDGRWFTMSCNNSGCYPITPSMPATEARKSTMGWHNYPQYKIFVNDPDTNVYPSGIIGQVVIPPPPGSIVQVDPHCDDGSIDFTFDVTSSGTVTLTLELSSLGSGFVDKEVLQTVTVGQNTMTWDGYDASVPPKLVPSGSTFPFTLTYVKGLTHLPLWDVENNQFGFLVNLVRPASTAEPNFFWDDTNINPPMPPGPTTSPPGGCQSEVNPCHIWYQSGPGGQPGDNKTINTWWYVSNTTTVPVTIIKKQFPGSIIGITGPSGVCQGTLAQYTCPSDSNSQQYVWTWPGGTDTTSGPFKIISFSPTAPPGPGQVTVKGLNAECGGGPVTTKSITINQIPAVTTSPLVKTICNSTSSNITLTANVTGSTFAWRAWSTNPNMGGYYNGSGSIISQTLTNSGTTIDSIRYRIAATAAGCLGDSVTYRVAVKPVPNLSNNPKAQEQCNNLNTLLELTSDVSGTLFTWTSLSSSPNLTGNSDNTTPTDSINDLLVNTGFTTETITYSITPAANNCTGSVTDYVVTVYPTPNLSNSPARKEICQDQSTSVSLTSNVVGTTFTWSCTQTSGNVTGWSANAGPGSTNINQILALSGVVKDSVIYHLTPSANTCDGAVADYKVIVNPVPQLNLSSMVDSICSEVTTNISLTSTVPAATFSWTASKGSGNIVGYSDGTGDLIAQQLTNPLSTAGSVLYTITPASGTCTGNNGVFTQWVKPLPHLTNQPKGDSICSGQSPGLTLQSDVANTWFTWTASGSSGNINGFADEPNPTTLLDQTLINSGFDLEWATYQVSPTAAGCDGPDSNYVVTVFPVADMSNDPPSASVCSGQSTGVTLTSHVTGTQFTWSAVGSSANVSGFSDQLTPTTVLDHTLVNSGDDIEWVTYQVTPAANGCDGIDTNFVVTVNPVPDLSNTPLFKEICNNNSTNIPLTSNVSGTLFTWISFGSSGDITGFTDNTTTPAILINDNLINSGSTNETATYRIIPHANGCTGDTVDYTVTVIPSPYLTNFPLDSSICNGQPTGLTLLSNVAGTDFTWTATGSSGNINGYSNSTAPGTLINQILVNSGFDVETVTYHVTPESSGCPGSVTNYNVYVFPVPDVFFVPNGETVCEGQPAGLSLQSHVVGTTFSWTATPSSGNLSGYSDGSGDVIDQTIDNAGATIETVTYQVTPEANGCPPGTTMPVVLTVNPRPAVTNPTTTSTQCNNATTAIGLLADVTGSTFAWRAFTASANLSGFSDGSGALISQTLTNSGYTIDTVIYRVAATANGCTGDSTDFLVILNP